MNYVITGSIGHISKPVVTALVKAGHQVSVITSNQDRVEEIAALGAKALVGSVEDRAFIVSAFSGADAVYLMIPPNWKTTNWLAYQQNVADNYAAAVKENAIKYVVQLSSIGAHLREGAGPIDGLAYLEVQLETLTDVDVKILRPSFFMYNLYGQIGLVKNAHIFGANYGSETEPLVLVDTEDIAKVVAENLLALSFSGITIQYIASDEKTTTEIATELGKAINQPNTPWVVFTDEQSLQGAIGAGFSEEIAKGYVQLGKAIREGGLQEDYFKHKPILGSQKLAAFAQDFAAAYHQ